MVKTKGEPFPKELVDIRAETDITKKRTMIRDYFDTNPEALRSQLGADITVISKLADILAATKGVEYGLAKDTGVISPFEQARETGRQYQGVTEQLLYNSVGADILRVEVDTTKLVSNAQSRDINYARLMLEASGFAIYTGTPELIAPMYEKAYGITLTQYGDNASVIVRNQIAKGLTSGKASVFEEFDSISNDYFYGTDNEVVLNGWDTRANTNEALIRDIQAKLPEGKTLLVARASGGFDEFVMRNGNLELTNHHADKSTANKVIENK